MLQKAALTGIFLPGPLIFCFVWQKEKASAFPIHSGAAMLSQNIDQAISTFCRYSVTV